MSSVFSQAARQAGARIAPTWPLDQLIAVNPLWELRDERFDCAAARLAALGGIRCYMPRGHYRALWQRDIQPRHLRAAAVEYDASAAGIDTLVAWLEGSSDEAPHWHNFSEFVDEIRDAEREVSWHEEIVFQISQFVASYFSDDRPMPGPAADGLYCAWLDSVRHDRGIEILMGEPGLVRQFRGLPDEHESLIDLAARQLDIPREHAADYFHALLLEINGWASWVAYRRWQGGLSGDAQDAMPALLAIRLAWELALWNHLRESQPEYAAGLRERWLAQFASLQQMISASRRAQQPAAIWQRAAELAYQEPLGRELFANETPAPDTRPRLQAAFCIDVRSEVMRRALERQSDAAQTLGFAGFFGLPIEYLPAGATYRRPQLPGLLAPALQVTDAPGGTGDEEVAQSAKLNWAARWQAFGKKAPAAFGFVEALGITYALKMLRETLFGAAPRHPVNSLCRSGPLVLQRGDVEVPVAEKAELACTILRAMTLTDNLAPVVMLVGHGSSTRNNPHAASLDCGACGGQTGEINVRMLAQLLNEPAVRAALPDQGITLPEDTVFVPALHDTTTDAIHLYGDLPAGCEDVRQWLQDASAAARAERAPRLGMDGGDIDARIRRRSRDWSQVRPEWGLAGNAAFLVAPRHRSQHMNLRGRSFLHDYDWRADAQADYSTLELIMTAPMVVTHWINMQYNASVTDNLKFGSGNKVLHNVVGGNLGVFEGSSGDLRIGLPLQSLHDGEKWMHQPLRLSVYIEAPAEAIAGIAGRHEVVRQLIDNDWLYLFRIAGQQGRLERFYRGSWKAAGNGLREVA